MGKTAICLNFVLLITAVPMVAQTPQESLGDLARQLRAQHDKEAKKATKVFTNDNLPEPKPGETISISPAPPAATEPSSPGSTPSKPATGPATGETGNKTEEAGNKSPESPEDKAQTRDYWQEKFKAARSDVAKAKSLQQLSEDELNLLQIQQVREMDPNAKADLTAKMQAKQSEVDANKEATEAAQKTLDDLEKAFKESGAPDDWSQTD